MVLTNRWLLTSVLVSGCFGALACSDEPASYDYGNIDASVRAPAGGDEEGDEDDDSTGKPKKDAGAKDAGTKKDAGAKDAGTKDAGTTRGIDAGATGGGGSSSGPSVVGATRDPNPAANIADSNGVPAVRTERCPAGTSTDLKTSQKLLLEGCCLASGQCGIVPTLAEYRTTCVTRQEALEFVQQLVDREIEVPPATTCSNSGN